MTNPVDAQSANSEEFVGSHLKSKNGYGQNGFQGASSDLPGKHTTSGFLPAVKLPAESADGQTRKVDATQITAHPGMKAHDNKISFPTNNVRAASKRALGGNFQR